MRQVNVGLIGLGTVGSGIAKIILEHHDDIMRHQGVDLRLAAVADLNEKNALDLGLGDVFTTDSFGVCAREDIDLIVEVIGGTGVARKIVLAALENGKHVATANKALMASFGKEIFELADSKKLAIGFEASCGGGIPIIGPLKHSLTGNEISSVMGIVNGTTNYMLTRMSQEGLDYADVLKQAQALGYAEADPTADVEGHDAAAKIAILASIAFNSRVTLDQVPTQGITEISPVDLQYADEMGYAIKLLAIANRTDEGIDIRVHPAMLPKEHPLASVNDVFNAIYVVGDYVGETMFFGRGAGSGPAASAVMGDIIEIGRMITAGDEPLVGCTCTDTLPIRPMEELATKYYLRFATQDKPGVLASTADIFGKHGVSICSFTQRPSKEGDTAEMIFLTHEAQEGAIQDVVSELLASEAVCGSATLIRTI